MATVAQKPTLTLAPEGTLAETPLPTLLAAFGWLRASCVLDLSFKKLTRRLVASEGRIEALISNARDDRFFEWLLAAGHVQFAGDGQLASWLERLGPSPLTAAAVVGGGLVEAEQAGALQREHLLTLLAETSGWKQCSYAIHPGKVELGREPGVGLAGVEAALETAAREKLTRSPQIPAALETHPALPPTEQLGLEALVAHALDAARKAGSSADLLARLTRDGIADPRALVAQLLRAGLLVPATLAPVATKSADASAEGAVTRAELERWLRAAEAEDLNAVLDVPQDAKPDTVRKAYYRAVRRYHPDRFREGDLSSFHAKVESAFRLVQEAYHVLTDPVARKAWEARKKKAQGAKRLDPVRYAKERRIKAQRAVEAGRRGDAVTFLEQALSFAPEDLDCRLRLALLLAGNPSRRAEALERLGTLAKAHGTRADVLASYAAALRKAGQEDEASMQLGRAKTLAPRDPFVRAVAGEAVGKPDPFLETLLG